MIPNVSSKNKRENFGISKDIFFVTIAPNTKLIKRLKIGNKNDIK